MIDDKVAADQRGHGLGVSLEVYSISKLHKGGKRTCGEIIRTETYGVPSVTSLSYIAEQREDTG